MAKYYRITVKMTRTAVALAKYKNKRFTKGKTYTVLRKLTPGAVRSLNAQRTRDAGFGFKVKHLRRV
jgi:hypothetical protein